MTHVFVTALLFQHSNLYSNVLSSLFDCNMRKFMTVNKKQVSKNRASLFFAVSPTSQSFTGPLGPDMSVSRDWFGKIEPPSSTKIA